MKKNNFSIKTITTIVFALTFSNIVFCQKTNNFNLEGKSVSVFTTADKTDFRISAMGKIPFANFTPLVEKEISVFVDPSKNYQTMLGIGGALTDAAAEVFAKLPKPKQDELIQAYYNTENGIGYTLARTNIASCDFSSSSYNYVTEKDSLLKSFSVAHDLEFRIPLIKKAIAATGNKLTLFASPWSPPSWMKDNNNVLNGGKLLPQYRQSWANYFVKFIKTYEALGVPIWGITAQNEPMGPQRWESCIFTPEDERDFIRDYLGPTLHKNGLANKKLMAWDQNRDFIYQQASVILNDKKAAKYVWGIGYHWYEKYAYQGSNMQFDNVKKVKEAFPDKNLLFTEGCVLNYKKDKLNDWANGEVYGQSMINDFNCGTVGWTDWNILLDERGGPNHVNNFLFAPVHADTKTGELTYTNSFYYIGHFSKFIRPGAKRVAVSCSRENILATAFLNTDGKLVVVVMNSTGNEMPFNLTIGNKTAKANCLAHSINTLIVN
jgi:glucosylceramidase